MADNNKKNTEIIPHWKWFWGTDELPTPEHALEIIDAYNVSVVAEDGIFLMEYNYDNMVATLHIYLDKSVRNLRTVARMILTAEKIAKLDGMVKILAPICAGNPFLKGGKQLKFGYELEAHFKSQTIMQGKRYDLFIYGKML